MEDIINIRLEEQQDGWYLGQAYNEGEELIGICHSSSSLEWAKHDMTEFKKQKYNELFPSGHIIEFDIVNLQKK